MVRAVALSRALAAGPFANQEVGLVQNMFGYFTGGGAVRCGGKGGQLVVIWLLGGADACSVNLKVTAQAAAGWDICIGAIDTTVPRQKDAIRLCGAGVFGQAGAFAVNVKAVIGGDAGICRQWNCVTIAVG